MTSIANDNEKCLCVGGPLHGYPLPALGGPVILTYRTPDLVARDRPHSFEYTRKTLMRTVDGRSESREFFVLDTLKRPDGTVIVQGLSDEEARDQTLAAPERFWK